MVPPYESVGVSVASSKFISLESLDSDKIGVDVTEISTNISRHPMVRKRN